MTSRKPWLLVSLLGLASVALLVVPVYALSKCAMCDTEAAEIVQKMESAQMTLTKAIEAAEKRTNGKAITAFTERDGEDIVFAVYVVKDGKVSVVDVKQNGAAGRSEIPDDVPGIHDEVTHKVEKKRLPGG